MFFLSQWHSKKGRLPFLPDVHSHLCQKIKLNERKTRLSPGKQLSLAKLPQDGGGDGKGRTPFHASLIASLTVEAAVVLPVFLVCMILVLQFLNVYGTAARLQSALTETGEEMAIGAYASEYGEKDSLLNAALSVAYGSARTLSRAGELSAVRNTNFLLSSFLEDEEMIHLVCSYQIRPAVGIVRVPWTVFLQRASVRAWTGRSGSDGQKEAEEGGKKEQTVYVTEHGSVYHKDRGCTHIRLSITRVSLAEARGSRNQYGQRYHACERCGRGAGEHVYITKDGNRYHSSLGCGGIKRTVREVRMSELDHLRPCSKCGGK